MQQTVGAMATSGAPAAEEGLCKSFVVRSTS